MESRREYGAATRWWPASSRSLFDNVSGLAATDIATGGTSFDAARDVFADRSTTGYAGFRAQL